METLNQLLQSSDFNTAVSLHQHGRLDEARDAYLPLLQTYPDAPPLLTALGTLALQIGDIPEGIRLIEQSLSLYPQQPSALSNVANGLSAIGRKAEALEKYEQAIALFPDYTDAHYNRGNLLLETQRYEEALASYEEKAGILKANCPAVIGQLPESAQGVVRERIKLLNCPTVWVEAAEKIADRKSVV